PRRRRAALQRGLWPGRGRRMPAPRRPAELLVPSAAAGATARVRPPAQGRAVALRPDRRHAGAPDACNDARRPLRRSLIRRALEQPDPEIGALEDVREPARWLEPGA